MSEAAIRTCVYCKSPLLTGATACAACARMQPALTLEQRSERAHRRERAFIIVALSLAALVLGLWGWNTLTAVPAPTVGGAAPETVLLTSNGGGTGVYAYVPRAAIGHTAELRSWLRWRCAGRGVCLVSIWTDRGEVPDQIGGDGESDTRFDDIAASYSLNPHTGTERLLVNGKLL